jgi:hypothetical protein
MTASLDLITQAYRRQANRLIENDGLPEDKLPEGCVDAITP